MARKTKDEALRTRQKLLESALEVMSQRPYSNISMTEIAERIGYSKGAIYWHFRNKHDLLIRLVDAACAKAEEEMSKTIGVEHSMDGLRRYYKALINNPAYSNKIKMFHNLMLYRQEWPEDVREKVTRLLVSRYYNERVAVEKMLTSLQKDGKIKKDASPKETAVIISAMFQGLLMFQVEMFQVEDVFWQTDFCPCVDFIFDALQNDISIPADREKIKA